MQQYLNYTVKGGVNYSFKHSFGLVFKKIETVLFSFLCVAFLVSSRVDSDFAHDLSFGIVEISMPVVQFIAFPFNATIDLVVDFKELVRAKKENQDLKEELEKLKSFYISSLNIHQENKELRNLLNFISLKSSTYKVARIIGKTHQVFNQKVYIDIGKNRGAKEGAIVVGKRGVIGRIAEVGDEKSLLILANDATSKIPVLVSKARARGILSGSSGNLMEILYLPKNHNIEVGDLVFTSGDGDTLPSGLLVGVVKKVQEEEVFVTMVEDINSADIVTIVE